VDRAKQGVKKALDRMMTRFGYTAIPEKYSRMGCAPETLTTLLSAAETLYPLLSDEQSKELLVQLLSFRILTSARMVLPLNTESFHETRKKLQAMIDPGNFIPLEFMGWKLYYFSLKDLGLPINIYLTVAGAQCVFFIQQYRYKSPSKRVEVEPDDVVIDCGACWGDTALYFALKAGAKGMVYAFEFIPSNLDVFRRNLEINPDLKDRIEIVDRPVWSDSGTVLYCSDKGSGSRVSPDKKQEQDLEVSTLTIDDLVKEKNLSRLDFIKMDIEGSEIPALEGALQTIRKFKPKLALSVYHKLDDFDTIPRLIDSLDLGYKFFLNHSTIHAEETVLFCVAD
jgi:FkbM family methyltransferase